MKRRKVSCASLLKLRLGRTSIKEDVRMMRKMISKVSVWMHLRSPLEGMATTMTGIDDIDTKIRESHTEMTQKRAVGVSIRRKKGNIVEIRVNINNTQQLRPFHNPYIVLNIGF